MKKFGAVFSMLLAVSLSGCLKVDQTLTINKDGSGQMEMSYSMQESTIRQMEAMSQMEAAQGEEGSGSGAEQFEFNEEALRKQFAGAEERGIKVESIDSKTESGWRTMHVKLSFKDLSALAGTEMMEDNVFSLKKNAKGNYVLVQKTGEEGAEAGDEAMPPEMMAQMAPMFAGMRIVQRVKVPGKVVSTNATENDGSTASWIFDIDKDPAVINKIQNLKMEIEFEGSGLDLKEI